MRTRLRLPLALVLAVGVVCTASAAWAQTRNVSGMVAGTDGSAVVGATVQVKDAPNLTTTTGPNGAFTLAKAPVGALVLVVNAEGFVGVEVPVKAGRAATALAVYLGRRAPEVVPTRVVSGLVRDAATHAGIAGATVRVRGSETGAVTDADGLFVLAGLPTSDIVLDVSADGHTGAEIAVGAGEGTTKAELVSTEPPPELPPPTEPTPTPPQERTLTGTIIEASTSEPLPGATVQVVGTDLITITDENGGYSLTGVAQGPVALEVSSVGYKTVRISVAADAAAAPNVLLEFVASEAIYIESRAPVIVKTNIANGASVVKSEDLNRVSSDTVESALQGKISGANVQANSGAPGGGVQIRLRGISTINGQASPLFVIDGIIVSNVAVPTGINAITAAAAGGNAQSQDNSVNRIADLNPNDIEDVEILKGPAAAALYGSQAANGVVIITTKRGGSGKTRVAVTQRIGFSQISNTIGSRKFGSMQEAIDAYGPGLGANYTANTFDHEKEIAQNDLATETIATAAGGTEAAGYYGSVFVKHEPGVVIGTGYDKQSGKLALSYDFDKRFSLGLTTNLIHSKSDRGLTNNDNTGTSYYVVLSSTPSFIDLRPVDGVYPANPFVGSGSNPLQTVQLFQDEEDVWRLLGSASASFKAWHNDTQALTLQANFGADRFQQSNIIDSPPELIFEPRTDGLAGTRIDGDTTNLNWNTGVGAFYTINPASKKFRSATSVGVIAGSQDLSSVYVVAQNLNAGQPSVDAATSVGVQETALLIKTQGVYAQEELSLLEDKLSILAAILGERSSVNGDVDKLYFYPKVAAYYSLPSMPKSIDFLRLRAAYGEAGNRPNYGQKFTPLNVVNNISGNPGTVNGGIVGDANIKPEHQREVEAGFDVSVKDERAVVEFTWYQRSISDLLLQRTLPPSSGFVTEFLNGGSLRNRGIEASVQATPFETKDFDWVSRLIFTRNRSEITDLPFPAFDITAAGFGAALGAYRIEEGKSATQIVGANPDLNPIGNGEPDFRVGFANNFRYKDFGLTTLLDWQQGSDIINLTRLLYDFGQVSPDYADPAKNLMCPGADPADQAGPERLNCFFAGDIRPYVEDATFLKLREVSLFWDVPSKWAEQIGPVTSLRLTLSGRNLLTFTNYTGLDPEVSNFGNQPIGRNIDVAPYPPSRSFWFSVDAGF